MPLCSNSKFRLGGKMTKTKIFAIAVTAIFLLGAWTASSVAQGALDRHTLAEQSAAAKAKGYVYWTNSLDGSVGRATIAGRRASESFITLDAAGGGGLTVDNTYIYWTSANGGTATTIARAKLDGSNVDQTFITGAQNPCGVAVDSAHIYWAGDVGSSIGRANLDGSGVNQNFIATGGGVCGVAATGSYIYRANYQTGNIGRAKLDGSDVNTAFISGCGSGIAIEGKYIYFTTPSGTAIGRAKISGKNVNPNFISGLNGLIAFIAADNKHVFWADWGSRGSGTTIGRANLDGTNVNQTLVQGTNGGFGIAVTGGNP
jgi:hypothetical protein